MFRKTYLLWDLMALISVTIFKPRLTTIRQHKEKIAARSVEILLDCIDNGARPVYEVEEFALVKGESVRKIN